MNESGDFFYDAHRTSIVWGGQKILFVFQHLSGRFGLYYDVQCPRLVSDTSGGGAFRTSTLLLENKIFIPVPAALMHNVVPQEGQKIKLDVRCDVLYMDLDS